MEIIIFNDKMFNEIPTQDNPTFDYLHNDRANNRRNECILVCKSLPYRQQCVGEGYTVTHIPLEGDIVARGLFWNIEDAETFAKSINLTL